MQREWRYRVATPEDSDPIAKLVNSVYRGESGLRSWTTEAALIGGVRISPAQIVDLVKKPNAVVLVVYEASEPEKIFACVELQKNPDGAYLGMLSVDSSVQRGGLGSFLLTSAEDFSREEFRSERMYMRVIAQRPELLAWYKARGYRVTGETQPFPYGNPIFGEPKVDGLYFEILDKPLGP